MSETRSVHSYQTDTIEAWEEQRKKRWHVYVEADLGLRNHWYPAFFGAELDEGDVSSAAGEEVSNVKSLTLLGERILFRRIDGEVKAVQDWCLHRGVPFSTRPESYTKDTITCWYHGFTYDMDGGDLTAVITDPECKLIGKVGLRTYPVEERKGLVFVFIGDGPPPPLEHDVQPGFLDEDVAVFPNGWTTEIACNWRPSTENGFDPAHAYIHRNSTLVQDLKMPLLLGDTDISRNHGMEIVAPDGDRDGPIGVKLLRTGGRAIWEADVHGVTVEARYRPDDEGVLPDVVPKEVSAWMPCGLKVDPFPTSNMTHYEWYVPIDERNHRYIMTWASQVGPEPEQHEAFYTEVIENRWHERVPEEFNVDDILAREAMDTFYAEEDGFYRERLTGPDVVLTSWRKLVSEHARGIQRRGVQ